jgi:hypothetical protein
MTKWSKPQKRKRKSEKKMDASKQKALEAAGWKFGDAEDFLEMTKQLDLFPQTNTADNCEKLANTIVDSMSMDELRQFVFDDVYSIMMEEKDVYLANVEHYGE